MRCDVCGQRVAVSTGNEGTSSYEPVAEEDCDRLREALEGDTLTAKRVYQLLEQRDALAEENARLRADVDTLRRVSDDDDDTIDRLREENEKLKAAMERIQAMVDRQAEDEGLWATPLHRQLTIGEAHTQQELRKLHALIEMFSKALADAGRGREGK